MATVIATAGSIASIGSFLKDAWDFRRSRRSHRKDDTVQGLLDETSLHLKKATYEIEANRQYLDPKVERVLQDALEECQNAQRDHLALQKRLIESKLSKSERKKLLTDLHVTLVKTRAFKTEAETESTIARNNCMRAQQAAKEAAAVASVITAARKLTSISEEIATPMAANPFIDPASTEFEKPVAIELTVRPCITNV